MSQSDSQSLTDSRSRRGFLGFAIGLAALVPGMGWAGLRPATSLPPLESPTPDPVLGEYYQPTYRVEDLELPPRVSVHSWDQPMRIQVRLDGGPWSMEVPVHRIKVFLPADAGGAPVMFELPWEEPIGVAGSLLQAGPVGGGPVWVKPDQPRRLMLPPFDVRDGHVLGEGQDDVEGPGDPDWWQKRLGALWDAVEPSADGRRHLTWVTMHYAGERDGPRHMMAATRRALDVDDMTLMLPLSMTSEGVGRSGVPSPWDAGEVGPWRANEGLWVPPESVAV
jgi:hypothetical protein